MPSAFVLYNFCRPLHRMRTSPTSRSTRRCFDTEGWSTRSTATISLTECSRPASSSQDLPPPRLRYRIERIRGCCRSSHDRKLIYTHIGICQLQNSPVLLDPPIDRAGMFGLLGANLPLCCGLLLEGHDAPGIPFNGLRSYPASLGCRRFVKTRRGFRASLAHFSPEQLNAINESRRLAQEELNRQSSAFKTPNIAIALETQVCI